MTSSRKENWDSSEGIDALLRTGYPRN